MTEDKIRTYQHKMVYLGGYRSEHRIQRVKVDVTVIPGLKHNTVTVTLLRRLNISALCEATKRNDPLELGISIPLHIDCGAFFVRSLFRVIPDTAIQPAIWHKIWPPEGSNHIHLSSIDWHCLHIYKKKSALAPPLG